MAHGRVGGSHGRMEHLEFFKIFPENPQGLVLWPGWAHGHVEIPHDRVSVLRTKP